MERASNKLGVALVGLGVYSEGQLGPALQETKYCYLAGVVTSSEKKKRKWKKKYNIPAENIYNYEDFDLIKNNDDIDVVYIVLPNSMHAEFVIRAAHAGKHVICEKPMAITVEQCDQMIEACREQGVMLSIGYRLHFDPYNLEMMRLAKERVYGSVKMISASHGLSSVQGWRLDKKLAGGGPLMDVGIYCVNAGRYLTNLEPIAVYDAIEGPKSDSKKFKDIEESLTWKMEYENGVIAECSCDYSKYGNHLHADAENGWFEIAPAFSYGGLRGKTSDGFINLKNINQQAAQMDDFALAIIGNRPTPVPGEMGRQDIKILQAIYRSMETGQRIEI
jgi:predicted dehydrogenase